MNTGRLRAQNNNYFTVRDAIYDDISSMMAIQVQSGADKWSKELFERELSLAWSHCWVVEHHDSDGDMIIGFLNFWVIAGEAQIQYVSVASNFRRRGFARLLIDYCKQYCRQQKIFLISLEVRESNRPAYLLYEGMGFQLVAKRPGYYSDSGESAIMMELIMSQT